MRKLKILLLLGTTGILSSCDLSQIPGLDKRLNIEDSKAIGAACRHSGRALEDCFTLNPMALQSGVFEGWRDMNDYMVANKIETVEPQIQNSHYKPGSKDDAAGDHDAAAPSKAAGPGNAAAGVGGSAGAWSPGGSQSPAGEGSGAPARPRWQPGQSGAAAPGAAPPAHASNHGASPGGGAPSATDAPSAAQSPKSDSPTRPWERKSGTKNTT